MERVILTHLEPSTLLAISEAMRNEAGPWDLVVADGGPDGVREALADGGADAVVVGLERDPESGLETLGWLRDRHPEVLRVAVAGIADVAASLQAARAAHEVLPWPGDPHLVARAIARGTALRRELADGGLRERLADMQELPRHPRIWFELSSLLEDMNCSASQVARLIEQDVGMTAKTLQLVNSGYFSFGRKVTSIQRAVTVLGGYTIRSLVLGAEMRQAFGGRGIPLEVLERIERRSLMVAMLATELAAADGPTDEVFAAGLLHDVGKLVLWGEDREAMEAARERAATEGRPVSALERELLGVDHAQVGAWLLGVWGLPSGIMEAAARHHAPDPEAGFDLPAVIHVAAGLVAEAVTARAAEEAGAEAGEGPGRDPWLLAEPPDPAFLDAVGVADSLPEWRRLARALVEREQWEAEAPADGRPARKRGRRRRRKAA